MLIRCSSSSSEGHSGCLVLDFRRLSDKPGVILYTPRSFPGIDEGIQPLFFRINRRAYAVSTVRWFILNHTSDAIAFDFVPKFER